MEQLGHIEAGGGTITLRFERTLEHPPRAVWAALTEQPRLVDWLNTTITLDPRPGGTLRFEFGDGDVCTGEVREVEPETALEYEWRFPGETTTVRWEIEAGPTGATTLRLVHRRIPADKAAPYAAGWHAHLDQLEAHLEGTSGDPSTRRREVFGPRYSELRPLYDSLVETLAAGG